MNWIEHLVEDQSTGSSSLRCSPRQIARGTIPEWITQEKECPLVHVLKQSNVRHWVAAKLHDVEERTVIHGIESILDVQVQQDHRMLGVALVLQKTLQFEELTLRAATFAKSFLCIFQELVTLHEAGRPLVDNVEKNDALGADARNRPKLSALTL
jgi:hypothetical protein